MLHNAPLGRKVSYVETYAPHLLFPVARTLARGEMTDLPFRGVDMWTAFELSWLNPKGKPEIAIVKLEVPCDTPFLIESKSMKLYFNSFNFSTFASFGEVADTICKDLSSAAGGKVAVRLLTVAEYTAQAVRSFSGTCLDHLDVETSSYQVDPDLLQADGEDVQEVLYSDLLKSNCLATGQPDWGTLRIHYQGPRIDHEGLLKYIISFRNHSGFAEHCVEQIYLDLLRQCSPKRLSVEAHYTRRGGLDIKPFRSNFELHDPNISLLRS